MSRHLLVPSPPALWLGFPFLHLVASDSPVEGNVEMLCDPYLLGIAYLSNLKRRTTLGSLGTQPAHIFYRE